MTNQVAVEVPNMVWPRLVVSDYPEMLRKLSAGAFAVTAVCLSLLRRQVPVVEQLFSKLDVTSPIEAFETVAIPFGTFIVALLVAFVSESVKLHDKISDVLRIRAVFDVRWILVPMALLSDATISRAKFDRIATDRKRLMADVFYRYASSAKEGQIDKHLITQALTAWSWYWLCVEATAIIVPTAVALGWFGQWSYVAVVLALTLVAMLLMKVFRSEANKYADAEVSEILADAGRRQAVKAAFNAL